MRIVPTTALAWCFLSPLPAQQWQQLPQAASPPVDANLGMAFDPLRLRTVCVVDEALESSPFPAARTSTWEWDGTRWLRRITAHTPPGTGYPIAVAFDPNRQRTMLVNTLNETWSFDGFDWQQEPITNPYFTNEPSLAFDASRNVLVLVHDGAAFEIQNGTWAYVPTQTPLAVFGSPVQGVRIAFHPATSRIVAFGGFAAGAVRNGTWTWDGTNWTIMSTAAPPQARASHQLVTSPGNGRVVLSGGVDYANNHLFADVFEWNGVAWLPSPPLPAARSNHVSAPYATHLLTFGGFVQGASPEWRSPDVLLSVGGVHLTIPSLHAGPIAAHDSLRGRTVSIVDGHTREFDGYRWTDTAVLFPTVPTAIAYHVASAHCVVLDAAGGTWLWNGLAWTLASPTTSPPPRTGAGMAYDPVRNRVVMFGGEGTGGWLADLWEWDGSNWSSPTQINPPAASSKCHLAWNPINQSVLLVRAPYDVGMTVASEWNGSSWTTLPGTVPYVGKPRLATDPNLGVVLVGAGAATSPPGGGVAYRWTGTQWQALAAPDQRATTGPVVFDSHRGALVVHDDTRFLELVFSNALPAANDYGTGCMGSRGVPRLAAAALPHIGAQIVFDVDRVAPNSLVLLFGGLVPASIPITGSCTALMADPIVLDAQIANASGFASLSWLAPANPAFRGISVYQQALAFDPNGALSGFAALSAGVHVVKGD